MHTAQRLAIEADGAPAGGFPRQRALQKGAQGCARPLVSSPIVVGGILVQKQTDPDSEKTDQYRASSYVDYQGDKLVNRFSAYCY